MELSISINDNCACVTVLGVIDTLTSQQFVTELESLDPAAKDIALYLGSVDYISSAGLRVLLLALDIAIKRGGKMWVAQSSEFVSEILTAVGFDKLFSVN